jgi:hypothetical protein
VFIIGKWGITPEHAFDNPLGAFILENVGWVLILTLLVILWTSRNRIALLLRSILLLLFSLILLPTLALILFWLGSEAAPSLVVFSAVTISLNFAFYYCLEDFTSRVSS